MVVVQWYPAALGLGYQHRGCFFFFFPASPFAAPISPFSSSSRRFAFQKPVSIRRITAGFWLIQKQQGGFSVSTSDGI